MSHIGNGVCIDIGGNEIILGSTTSIVILDNVDVDTLWDIGNGSTLEKQGSEEEVVPLERPILLDELAVQERDKEESDEKGDTEGNTQDAAYELAGSPRIKISRWGLRVELVQFVSF